MRTNLTKMGRNEKHTMIFQFPGEEYWMKLIKDLIWTCMYEQQIRLKLEKNNDSQKNIWKKIHQDQYAIIFHFILVTFVQSNMYVLIVLSFWP